MKQDATEAFASRLLRWFDANGRHDLPWQHPRTPYRVWLSEIMLQQTQVQVVIPYFERFVAALPDLPALARAPLDEVLALWSGLGYYARARNLHAAARLCVQQHGGDLPRDLAALMALPGIGRSTAGAILAQAWGDRHPILDGNVKRVLARLHAVEGWPGASRVERRLWEFAGSHLPHARMADYVQAQMDLGATVCTRHAPACLLCPVSASCQALAQGRVAELPTPRPGRPLPRRETTVLLAWDARGHVLLQRRPPAGIWASLWSLPEAEDEAGARALFEARLRGNWDEGAALEPVDHAFTHYQLTIRPRQWLGVASRPGVLDDDSLRWVAPAELGNLGIPAPIRRLLERSQEGR